MPVIPGLNQGQVLNAGSPVPVASPEEARMQGNALAQAGGALFAVGDILDTAAKQQRSESARVAGGIAAQSLNITLLEEQAKSMKALPLDGDETGAGQVKDFNSRMQEHVMAQANTIADPSVRNVFMLEAQKDIGAANNVVFANELKKRTEANQIARGKIQSLIGQRVAMDPNELEHGLLQVEESVRDNPNIAPAEMGAAVETARKQVLFEAVNGRKNSKDFDAAQKLLTQYGGGVFDAQEKDKLFEEIQSAEHSHYTQELQKAQLEEKQNDKKQKKDFIKSYTYSYNALTAAGVNEAKRQAIFAEVDQMVAANKMSPEQATSLKANRTFESQANDLYETNIMKEVYKSGNYETAIDKVYNDAGITVDHQRANELSKRLMSMRARELNDPQFKSEKTRALKLIEDLKLPTVNDPMSGLKKREHAEKVDALAFDFTKQLGENPKQDPKALVLRLKEQYFGTANEPLMGPEDHSTRSEDIKKKLDETFKKYLEIKDLGSFTKDQDKVFKNNLRVYKLRLDAALEKENAKQNPSSSVPTLKATEGN